MIIRFSRPAVVFLGALLPALLASVASAQTNFTINWYTIDSGGGLSTGGVYTVTGTIGQPEVGTATGGNFSLQGGFWGLVGAVQTPGAPLLSIGRTNSLMAVSWPLPTTGFFLEQTNRLTGLVGAWPAVPASQYQTNASSVYFTLPISPGTNFFRLRKPSP
jgi:hypothetical protein